MSKKKILIGSAAAAVLLIIAFVLIFIVLGGGLKDALNAENYNTVQVKALIKNDYIGKDNQNSSMLYTEESNETGSGVTSSTDGQQGSKDQEISVMQKQGDVIYESGLSGKYYFYDRDQKSYVLYYDTLYGIYKDGKWVETPAENFNLHPLFDFGVLKQLSVKDFKRSGGSYEPVADSLDKVFFAFFNISNSTKSKYKVYDLKLTLKNKRLESIIANYVYSDTYVTEQTLKFTYDKTELTVPKADETYQQNPN